METKLNLLELLDFIDPSATTYQEWVNVGMALKHEGYTAADWDQWSSADSRHKSGECFTKWMSFEGNGIPVTGATITQMAKDNGWQSNRKQTESRELGWDEVIGDDEYVVVDKNWIEGKEIQDPVYWNPVRELTTYLSTLFDATDTVGYVTETYPILDEKTGETIHKPTKGAYDRTAGQLIQELNNCGGDIGAVIGDYNEEAGAWIRFNPLDGKGVKNDNVADFRYALVESDNMEIEKQNAVMRELELPIAVLVHSGRRSIHAIVRIDADNYDEYRKRVDYLYNVCKKNGLNLDNQNRNPSRLSRLPGIVRNGKKQFIIDTNIGKADWAEWNEWIEDLNDDLPDMESLSETYDNLPELSPPLIEGLLRQGHKMLMAGPSKAGKSFALIELTIAIGEGVKWLAWQCAQGKVLYVNLELDRASALHRFRDVYEAMGIQPKNIDNIDIWNLRGKSVPMDKLAPKLIRRAHKKGYTAVIIDPIYKVLTGDENSADQMAHFTNQFDKIATELGCSVIYAHHHSKGSQGNKKSMDRSSGSGVFARDPDAVIDLIELELTEKLIKQQETAVACQIYSKAIETHNFDYFEEHVSQDDMLSPLLITDHAKRAIPTLMAEIDHQANEAVKMARVRSAWRVEGTLREYPKFDAVNMWFEYPVHRVDDTGILKDVEPEGSLPPWQNAMNKRKDPEDKKKERIEVFEEAYDFLAASDEAPVTVYDLAEHLGVTERTVWNRIKEHGGFKSERDADSKTSTITKKQA